VYTFPVTLKMQTHTLLTFFADTALILDDSARDPLDPDGCEMPGDVRDAFVELEAKIWQMLDG